MVLSSKARKRLEVAMSRRAEAREVADAVDASNNKVNELIAAYNALLTKLNNDTGVASSDYGSGAEAAPEELQ